MKSPTHLAQHLAALLALKRLWPQLAALGAGRIVLVNGGRVSLDAVDGELALDVQAEPEKLLPAVVE